MTKPESALDEIRVLTAAIVSAEAGANVLRERRNGLFRSAHRAGCTAAAIAVAAGVNKSWVHQIIATKES